MTFIFGMNESPSISSWCEKRRSESPITYSSSGLECELALEPVKADDERELMLSVSMVFYLCRDFLRVARYETRMLTLSAVGHRLAETSEYLFGVECGAKYM